MTSAVTPIATSGHNGGDGRSLIQHTAYYMIGRVATGVVGLVTLVVFTRVLSPEDYGRYAVMIAVAALVAAVGFQWIRQCLVRFAIGPVVSRQPLLGTLGMLFFCLSAALLVIVLASGMPFVAGPILKAATRSEIPAICLLAFATAWFELSADGARTEFRLWRYSSATFIRALLALLLGLGAALLTHDVVLVVVAMGLAYLLASAVALPRWFSELFHFSAADWSEVKRLVAYGLPLAGMFGMAFLLDGIDRLMLAGMRGYTEAGVYSSAYNLASFSIGTVLSGLGLGSLPLAVTVLTEGGGLRTAALLGNNLTLGVFIALPATIGLVMVAPELDRVLLGNYVSGHSDIVTMVVAVGVMLSAVRSYCVDVVFMLERNTWMQALVIGAAGIVNVCVNLLLIPRWGATGAAFASLCAFAFAFVASWILTRRYMKIPLALADLRKIAVGCLALAIVVAALSFVNQYWLRLVLKIACGAGVYVGAALLLDIANSRRRLQSFVTVRGCGADRRE